MKVFKDIELKEQVRMFNDYCETYEISDDQWNSKCKDTLQQKLFDLYQSEGWNKENVKTAIYESLHETYDWEQKEDSFDKYLKDHGVQVQ